MGKFDFMYGPASGAEDLTKIPPTLGTVNQALQTTASKLANDPQIISSGKFNDLYGRAQAIASGSKPSGSGIGPTLAKGFFDVLGGIGYVAGAPARVVASGAKEIGDLVSGEGFSIKDFASQAADETFYMSKIVPKSGNKWLDGVLGFGIDVLTDPLTYVTFGAGAFAGKAGRAALVTKAGEAANIAKAPSLAAKIADGSIMRYGEWALDDAERALLNVPKGLSWQFGSRGTIGTAGKLSGKVSAKSAELVGKPFASARARIGDLPMLEGVQKITAPKSIKAAGLTDYGRRNLAGQAKVELPFEKVIGKVASYSAAGHGASKGKMFVAKLSSQHQDVIKDIVEYETRTGNKLVDVIENVRPAANAEEARLAKKLAKFQADVRDQANNITSDFGKRRSVNAYGVGYLDNYVNHTLSDEARELLASENWKRTSPYKSNIEEMLDMSSAEFVRGPAPMRARTLETGKDFLGVTLKTDNGAGFATMKEINEISMNKLGVKWFADDAATYTNSYVNSIGNQVRRIGFVDRLYDYGPDVIKAIQYKMIPDKKLIASWRKTVGSMEAMINELTRELSGLSGEVGKTVNAQRNIAKKIVDRADRNILQDPVKVARMTAAVEKAKAALDAADAVAATKSAEIRSSYATLSAPVRAKLDAIQSAISRSAQDELEAVTVLEAEHVRMFPKMKNRPTDAQTLAEQIISKSESRTKSRLAALETRKKRLQRKIGSKGKVTKAVAASGAELEAAEKELLEINKQIRVYTTLSDTSSPDFPDGYFILGPNGGVTFDIEEVVREPNFYKMYLAPSSSGLSGDGAKILKPYDNPTHAEIFMDSFPQGVASAFDRIMLSFGGVQGATFGNIYDQAIKRLVDPTVLQLDDVSKRWIQANPELVRIISDAVQTKKNLIRIQGSIPKTDSTAISEALSDSLGEFIVRSHSNLTAYYTKAIVDGTLKPDMVSLGPEVLAYQSVTDLADSISQKFFTQDDGGLFAMIELPLEIAPEGMITASGRNQDTVIAISKDWVQNNGKQLRPYDDEYQTLVSNVGQQVDYTSALMAAQETQPIAQSMVETARLAAEGAPAATAQVQDDIAKIGMQAGGIKSGQTRLQQRVDSALETVRRSAEEVPVPSGKPRGRVKVTRAEAEEQAQKLEKKIAADTKAMEREIKNDPTMSAARQAADAYDTAQSRLDVAEALKGTNEQWEATFGVGYRTDLQELDDLVKQMPPKGASAEMHSAWRQKVTQTLGSLQQAGLSPQQQTAIERVITQMAGLESQVALIDGYRAGAQSALDNALTGVNGGKLVRDIEKGWTDLEALGVRMPDDVHDALFNRVRDLNRPEDWGKFKSAYMAYHRFFKITAMLTPGFIVRNAYTAAFNNFVAGVTLAETRAGIKFAYKASREGLDAALRSVPKRERKLYETAYRAVLATGGGQTADDLLYPVIRGKGSSYLDKRPVRNWIQANEATETAVRMATALHALNTGADLDGAAALITRYHFNYSDMSTLDEWAKQFVPFWTFATRNIPLQIVNQVARPSAYRAYESLQRNFPVEEGTVLPPWLASRGPLGLTSGVVVNPDLPQIDLQDQVRMLADPQRLVSQLNPLIKLPVELMGNRMLATDTPFSEKQQEYRGILDLPATLVASLLGQTGRTAEGDLTLSTKAAYALPNLFPTLATAQRLIPQLGGKEAYLDRQIGSIGASALGSPLRGISATEQENELTRRQFALRDLLAQLTMQGYNIQG